MKVLGIVFFVVGLLTLLAGVFINIAYLTDYFPCIRPFIIGGLFLIFISALFHYRTIRQVVSQRSTRYGLSMAFSIVFIAGLLVVINFFCIQHNKRLDLTVERLYSLSPLTLKILNGLKEPVTITAFTGLGHAEKERIKDLLDAYQLASNKLNIRYVDPDRNPILAK